MSKIKNNLSEIAICLLVSSQLLGNLFYKLSFSVGIVINFQRVVTVLVLAYCVLQFFKKKVNFKSFNFESKMIFFFFAFWIFYACVLLLFVRDKYAGMSEILDLIQIGIIILAMILLVRDERSFRAVITTVKFCSAVLVLVYFIQLIYHQNFGFNRFATKDFLDYAIKFDLMPLPTTVFFNENDMCSVLVIAAVFFIFDMLDTNDTFKIFYNYTMVFLIFLITGISNARISELGTLFCFIFIIFFLIIKRKNEETFKRNMILSCSGLAVTALITGALGERLGVILCDIEDFFEGLRVRLISSIPNALSIRAGILPAFSDFSGLDQKDIEIGVTRSSFTVRIALIKEGLIMLKDSWFFGVGPAAFKDNISNIYLTKGLTNPHNLWIEILAQYGILIFVPFCFIFFKTMFRFAKSAFSPKTKTNSISVMMLLAAISFVISTIPPSSCLSLYPMWIFFGIIIASGNLIEES